MFPETVAVAGPVPFTFRTAKSALLVLDPPIRRSRVDANFGAIVPLSTFQSETLDALPQVTTLETVVRIPQLLNEALDRVRF